MRTGRHFSHKDLLVIVLGREASREYEERPYFQPQAERQVSGVAQVLVVFQVPPAVGIDDVRRRPHRELEFVNG